MVANQSKGSRVQNAAFAPDSSVFQATYLTHGNFFIPCDPACAVGCQHFFKAGGRVRLGNRVWGRIRLSAVPHSDRSHALPAFVSDWLATMNRIRIFKAPEQPETPSTVRPWRTE
jgi:hypothetical protein